MKEKMPVSRRRGEASGTQNSALRYIFVPNPPMADRSGTLVWAVFRDMRVESVRAQ